MKMIKIFIVALFSVMLFITSCSYDKGEVPVVPVIAVCDTMVVTYNSGMSALLSTSCAVSNCHEAASIFGDFTTYDGIKTKYDNETLNNRVFVQKDMPPSYSTITLTDAQLQMIRCWIEAEAPEN